MPLKVGKRTKGGLGRRKRVKVDKDLPLPAGQRAVKPSQGREVVVLWDGNNLWVGDPILGAHPPIDLVEPGPTRNSEINTGEGVSPNARGP